MDKENKEKNTWEIRCGFCQNTVIFKGLKKGQKAACPKCNFTLEFK